MCFRSWISARRKPALWTPARPSGANAEPGGGERGTWRADRMPALASAFSTKHVRLAFGNAELYCGITLMPAVPEAAKFRICRIVGARTGGRSCFAATAQGAMRYDASPNAALVPRSTRNPSLARHQRSTPRVNGAPSLCPGARHNRGAVITTFMSVRPGILGIVEVEHRAPPRAPDPAATNRLLSVDSPRAPCPRDRIGNGYAMRL